MTCVALRLHDNGTPEVDDDTVMGFCVTQTPETAAEQCTADTNCTGSIGHGDKCDLGTKACYLSSALVGDACGNDADCGDGDTCLQPPSFPFPGGYCVRYGCDISSIGRDNGGCPPEALCVPQGGGTGTCERSCTLPTDCRSGYSCISIGNGQSICNPS